MRLLIRTLMFLACLMYGMMPGMAAGSQVSHDMPGDHSGQAATIALDAAKKQSDPCPHEGSMTHAPFCAACLVLLPDLTFAKKGTSPQAAPLPDVQAAFIGNQPAPPLPPPRA